MSGSQRSYSFIRLGVSVWERGLGALIESQRHLRKKIDGENPTSDKNAVRTTSFALIVEISELAAELGWKPWRRHDAPNIEKILDEWADVTAYYGTLASIVMDRTGCTVQELAEAYRDKHMVNERRFAGEIPGFAPILPTSEEQTPLPSHVVNLGGALYRNASDCPTCQGHGRFDDIVCPVCAGTGFAREENDAPTS